MNDRSRAYGKLLLAGLLLVLAGQVLGRGAWASGVLAPQRQTVPLTPPPSWTPETPVGPIATRPQPPAPEDEESESEGANPWLGLSVAPQLVAPGVEVTLRVQLLNQGKGELSDAIVAMTLPRELEYAGGSASSGLLEHTAGSVLWAVRVAAQGESMLEVRARVRDDVLPDRQIEFQAQLTWPSGGVSSNVGVLELPWALLP